MLGSKIAKNWRNLRYIRIWRRRCTLCLPPSSPTVPSPTVTTEVCWFPSKFPDVAPSFCWIATRKLLAKNFQIPSIFGFLPVFNVRLGGKPSTSARFRTREGPALRDLPKDGAQRDWFGRSDAPWPPSAGEAMMGWQAEFGTNQIKSRC